MKMHDALGSDGYAVAHRGMEMPARQHVQNLLLDAVTDALQQLGLDTFPLESIVTSTMTSPCTPAGKSPRGLFHIDRIQQFN
jgi:aspartate aminotransferase-like enzyme